jgi:hypothetical protein
MKSSSFENAKKNNFELVMNQSRKYFSKVDPVHSQSKNNNQIKSHPFEPSPLATK